MEDPILRKSEEGTPLAMGVELLVELLSNWTAVERNINVPNVQNGSIGLAVQGFTFRHKCLILFPFRWSVHFIFFLKISISMPVPKLRT